MTIFQKLLNLDTVIEKTPIEELVFINDLPSSTEKERRDIIERLTTQYMQGDRISMLPTCQCGCFRSESMKGLICPHCNTVVKSSIESDIQSVVWFRTPVGIDSLMNPIVYTMLSERFSKQGWNVIEYLTDTNYTANSVKDTTFMQKVRERGFERGWNAFHRQFDEIMEFLFSIRELNQSVKRGEIDYLYYLLKKDREKIFCKYLPLPNRSLFVFENTNTGIYRNEPTGKAMNYISLMISIEKSIQDLSQRSKENRVARLFQRLADYQREHIKTELSPKQGQIRRHTIATRNILAYRSVITSITDPHDYNGITVPWTVGLTMFRLHLINKLMKFGMSHYQALDLLMKSTGQYNALLHGFLLELIAEAPDGKIWCTIQRNPSLKQGSMLLVYIAGFKTDPADKTTGMPLPLVANCNADFDGDALNITMCLDNKVTNLMETFKPYFNVKQLDRPGKLSGNIYLSKSVVGSLGQFFACETE